MNIVDFSEARLARGYPSCPVRVAAPRRRLRPRVFRWPGIGQVVLLLVSALLAALGACQPRTAEPSDAQLIAIVRQYGAALPRPVDPVAGRAVRVRRTPSEWVVTLTEPRRLDAPRRRYVEGVRSAYHIDRATLRVVAVVVAG